MKKKCFKCGKTLPLEMFYKHSRMKDGHLNKCKECTKKDSMKTYKKNMKSFDFVWSERQRNRRRAKPTSVKKRKQRTQIEKDRIFIRNQVRRKLPNPPAGTHYHHWSYNREDALDVFSFNTTDHNIIHRYMVYDDEQKKHRRLDGVLIDTRDSAERYYKYVLGLKDGEYPSNPPM